MNAKTCTCDCNAQHAVVKESSTAAKGATLLLEEHTHVTHQHLRRLRRSSPSAAAAAAAASSYLQLLPVWMVSSTSFLSMGETVVGGTKKTAPIAGLDLVAVSCCVWGWWSCAVVVVVVVVCLTDGF